MLLANDHPEAESACVEDIYSSDDIVCLKKISQRSKVSFLGIEFDDVTMEDVLSYCDDLTHSRDFHYITTPNVDHVVTMHSKQAHAKSFRLAEKAASVRLCDSRIIALLARLSGIRLPTVPGSDLTTELLRKVIRPGHRVAIVGGDDTLLEKLREISPNVVFLQHIPPMGVLQNEAAQDTICRFVERADADFVFLVIGAPQSEVVAQAIAASGRARGLGLCVGASLAFHTGQLRRAPRALQIMHLEWAFRLLSEPRRLWHRYMVKGPRIFRIWWQYQFAARETRPAY